MPHVAQVPACTCYNCGETLYEGEEVVEEMTDGAIYCDEMCCRAEFAKFNAMSGLSLVPEFRKITLSAPEPDPDDNRDDL